MSYQQNMQSPWGQNQGGHQQQGNYQQNFNQGQGGPVSNPFFNNAMGMIHNKEFQQMGANYLQSEVERRLKQAPSLSDYLFSTTIRSYFDIDNKYVLKKLLKIIFPFAKADADSQHNTAYDTSYGYGENSEERQKKRLMAPDLYIPLMSFMTFILMVCLARGIGKEFNPDLISKYTFNCLIFATLEMLLYKLILLIVRVRTLSFLDMMAFLNYKFVGLCIILMSSFIIGGWVTTVLKVYFSISFVYHMYIELRSHAQGVAEVDIGKASLKSDTIVYFLSGLQFLTMWLLVLTMI